MEHQQILDKITNRYHSDITVLENISPGAIKVPVKLLTDVCSYLHQEKDLYFDMLACITGIDNGPEAGTMEVVYSLNSIPYGHQLTVKVELSRTEEGLHLPTLTTIWKTADWHEREIFDMLGIKFTDHPDLRRILLPADWTGYPLRKDYVDVENYHGVTVK